MDTKLIKERLLRLGWSQSELARRMSVNDSTVSHWLNGSNDPSATSLTRLGDLLCLSVDEMLGHPSSFHFQKARIENQVYAEWNLGLLDEEFYIYHDANIVTVARMAHFPVSNQNPMAARDFEAAVKSFLDGIIEERLREATS